ncbi:hypothetical protein [Bdellovibrio sp.]|uniref:hypothetical protein n=1 Tax=Bdellovibrio sp. TaxID=28201 RepID=UPI0039E54617
MIRALALLPLLFSLNSQATEQRTFTKLGPDSALVKIVPESSDTPQAATYVDGNENVAFIEMMLADPQSSLAQTKQQLEMENCGETSTSPDGWIPSCGRVELTSFVRTSFGRGGWMEAGAGYTFFVGFRFAGSGHFFESRYMATLREDVIADVDEQMQYQGSLSKNLGLEKIVILPLAR